MSLRPLGSTALAVAITATVSAGEIRGRVLVDGKPDATLTVRALAFASGMAALTTVLAWLAAF